ncbi:GGDEF domain-containing protein [Dactylosporangium sp. NPDC005572]|uniref:GGDEF domain-containing protein n=1 Tax=Dactylosporangium sp. NPDC005572 TaxID=3156889 RepID=UPI0033A20D83
MTTVREHDTKPPVWALFAVFGTLTAVGFVALQTTGDVPVLASALYTGLSAITAGVILAVTHRRRPPGRRGWYLLGASQLAYALGDAAYLADPRVFPGLADVCYLMQYPLIIGALVSFVRRRTPGWQLTTMFDAGIMAIGAGLVSWVYLIGPLTADEGMTATARAVTVAYPVGDLLVLVIAMRLLLGGGARTPSFLLLLGGLLTMAGGDTVHTLAGETGDGWSSFLWLMTYALFGAAALHPSMHRIDEPLQARPAAPASMRLVALGAVSLLAPVVLLVQYRRGDVTDVPVIAVACALLFLLVLGRMAGLVAAQHRIAVTDALTGLTTRGAFEERLRAEAGRRHRAIGVVLLDIDHFKHINDSFGHPAGDRVLRDVARRLRAAARAGDLVARYGGEEFALLVSDADEPRLAALAERIRRVVAAGSVDVGGGVFRGVTVSIGTAVLPGDAETPDELVQVADRALYAAKRAGRDRVVAASQRPAAAEHEGWPEPVPLPRSRRSEFEAA